VYQYIRSNRIKQKTKLRKTVKFIGTKKDPINIGHIEANKSYAGSQVMIMRDAELNKK
jgi:hypothetical protein